MSYSAVKTGRKYTGIEFYIQYKKPVERLEAQTSAEKVLTP
jgi:plasmid replication initiation protein